MDGHALTRASTIGPLVDVIDRDGGSVARVFRAADLPVRLVERPEMLVPLAFQTRLVAAAAREIGDDLLPVRLSAAAGTAGLGAYAGHVLGAPTLGAAIAIGNALVHRILQSSTVTRLERRGATVRWLYRVDAPLDAGRAENEMLAVGYILAMLRRFAGPGWTPIRVEFPGPPPPGRAAIERGFAAPLARGPDAAVVFPADLLDVAGPGPAADPDAATLPAPHDLPSRVRAMVDLAMLDGAPRRERVAAWLGLSTRTMQRRLADDGLAFAALLAAVRADRAADLLGRGAAVADVAFELGYSDPAHFARAFRAWTGRPPSSVRAGRRPRRPAGP